MKRILSSFCLVLASVASLVAQPSGYTNNQTVLYPGNVTAQALQIDALSFVNNGSYNIKLSGGFGGTTLFQTSDTLNFINNGTMICNPGFDFQTWPSSSGTPHMASSFVNSGANGNNGGVISCLGFDPANQFHVVNYSGNNNLQSQLIISATNIQNSGVLSMDNHGLIRIEGQNIDLSRGKISMPQAPGTSSSFGIYSLDYGSGTTAFPWNPKASLVDLPPTNSSATSAYFLSSIPFSAQQIVVGQPLFVGQRMALSNARRFYFEFDSGQSPSRTNSAGDPIVDKNYCAIYISDSSPANVTINPVYTQGGLAEVQWSGLYTNPVTKASAPSYFTFAANFADITNTAAVGGVPIAFSFPSLSSPLTADVAAVQSITYKSQGLITNFAYLKAQLIPTPQSISVIGNYATNLSGTVRIKASGKLDLAMAQINAASYISLESPDYRGNAGALITSPYCDIHLGTPSGSLTFSNLFSPSTKFWNGPLETWATAWEDDPVDITKEGTNYFKVLFIRSSLAPFSSTVQQDLVLHATNAVTLSDPLNIAGNFLIDSKVVTITSNSPGAYSFIGSVNLMSPDTYWSSLSLPNLQCLTNWGGIYTVNQATFAHNFIPPYYASPAAPYQSFVNHGSITNQGTFIRSDYFENTGLIKEGTNGSLDISANNGVLLNGRFAASGSIGSIQIAGGSLIISNHPISSASTLTLASSNYLSDGFTLGNQYGLSAATTALSLNINAFGNKWLAGGSLNLTVKPAYGDLLGTVITNRSPTQVHPNASTTSLWAGHDRGRSAAGFTNNAALGRLVLDGGTNGIPLFNFAPVNCTNALYVDSIEFINAATNTDLSGSMVAIGLAPGMKIYYAQAISGNRDIGSQLDGMNGGGFCWVSNYAGYFSLTNITRSATNVVVNRQLSVLNPALPTAFTPTLVPVETGYCGYVPPSPGGGSNGPSAGAGEVVVHPASMVPIETNAAPAGSLFRLAQGSYNGLFYDTNGVTAGSAGSFSAQVGSDRKFSATFRLSGVTYSLKGLFDSSGLYSNPAALPRSRTNSLSVLLQLDLGGDDRITGTVSDGSWISALYADRAFFSSSVATKAKGSYTLSLPGSYGAADLPSGDGFGTLTVSANGTVSWSLKLADGTVIPTQTTALSKQGYLPLVYSYVGGSGLLLGWLQLNQQPDSQLNWPAVWIKSPATSSKYYPAGFASAVSVLGARYTNNVPLINYTKAMLVFQGGNLAVPFTNHIQFTPSGWGVDSTTKKQVLHITGGNGLFLGNLPGRVSLFQGALFQGAGTGSGFFLGTNQSGRVYFVPAD